MAEDHRGTVRTDRLPIVNATQVDVRRLQGIEVLLSAVHIVSKTLAGLLPCVSAETPCR